MYSVALSEVLVRTIVGAVAVPDNLTTSTRHMSVMTPQLGLLSAQDMDAQQVADELRLVLLGWEWRFVLAGQLDYSTNGMHGQGVVFFTHKEVLCCALPAVVRVGQDPVL